ncbi:hypothetical protein AAG906_019718 [Vitis piasezkii]
MAPGKRPRPPIIPKQLEDNVNAAHKMTKNDIQRLSTDQLSQGQEGIPPLVQTSGTCREDTSGRIIGTSPIKEANRTPPNVQVDVAHTSLNETPQNTTTNATLQANGTHSRHQNNSTCKHIELLIHFYLCKILRMEMTPQFPPTLQDCGTPRNVNKTQLDTIAPTIMDMSETPIDPNNNTSTMDADSTTGKEVGLESSGTMRCWDDKLIQVNGSRPLGGVEIKPKIMLQWCQRSRMKSEIGTIVRNYAPLDVEKWADISKEKFIIDFTQDHVKKAIEGKMVRRYEITKQVPQAFQEVPNNTWDWLCDRFASKNSGKDFIKILFGLLYHVDHGPLYNMWKNW